MKVYIIYDRYEHDEFFSVYHIGTDRTEAINEFKTNHLPSFILYGPDDCHLFQLIEVKLPKKQYSQLLKWEDEGQRLDNCDSPYYQFMRDLHNCIYDTETIICTNGCSDIYEVVRYYAVMYKNCSCEDVSEYCWYDTDEYEEYFDELTTNDELWTKIVKEYVSNTY